MIYGESFLLLRMTIVRMSFWMMWITAAYDSLNILTSQFSVSLLELAPGKWPNAAEAIVEVTIRSSEVHKSGRVWIEAPAGQFELSGCWYNEGAESVFSLSREEISCGNR